MLNNLATCADIFCNASTYIMSLGENEVAWYSKLAVKYAVDLDSLARRQAANNPATSFSPISAPLFFSIPAGCGVDEATATALSKSAADLSILAPEVSNASLPTWIVTKLPTPSIGTGFPSTWYVLTSVLLLFNSTVTLELTTYSNRAGLLSS